MEEIIVVIIVLISRVYYYIYGDLGAKIGMCSIKRKASHNGTNLHYGSQTLVNP